MTFRTPAEHRILPLAFFIGLLVVCGIAFASLKPFIAAIVAVSGWAIFLVYLVVQRLLEASTIIQDMDPAAFQRGARLEALKNEGETGAEYDEHY